MSLFNDVVINAKNIATAVSKKTGEVLDKSKVKIAIADITNEMNKNYRALGVLSYEILKDNEDISDEIKEYIVKIGELDTELKSLKETLSIMDNEIKCQNCGSANKSVDLYCSRCGSKL